jgi:hypothetical protein
MASKKKTEKIEKPEIIEEITPEVAPEEAKIEEVKSEQPEIQPENVSESKKSKKEDKKVAEKEPKYKIGSIVFVSREAEADLNGFKLFPQYKKYTYTVEAYDAISDVYTLRRLNLSLRLKEAFILAPEKKAHDSLNRRQF